jgi:hypothetical protein
MKLRTHQVAMLGAVLTALILAPPATSQTTPPDSHDERTVSGTVVSSSTNTLVIKTEAGAYQMYIFDQYTIKPNTLTAGALVQVRSTPSSDPGLRVATVVMLAVLSSTGQPKFEEPVPASIRRLEDAIKRETRKFGIGFRAGVGLDPEVILVGVHARLGPFFSRNLSFRPNVEFGFGEVTKLFAINLDAVYRLPFTPREGSWSAYLGAGPNFSFVSQSFARAETGNRSIDFDDFSFQAGLNILTGVQFRSGLFLEAKTTVYASPVLRLIMGYTF